MRVGECGRDREGSSPQQQPMQIFAQIGPALIGQRHPAPWCATASCAARPRDGFLSSPCPFAGWVWSPPLAFLMW